MDRSEVQALVRSLFPEHTDYLSVIGAERSSRLPPTLAFRSCYTPFAVMTAAQTFEALHQAIRDRSTSGDLEKRLWELLEDDHSEMLLDVGHGSMGGLQ